MQFKKQILAAVTAALITGGTLAAAPGGMGRGRHFGAGMGEHRLEMLGTHLGLTDAQKQSAKEIFEEARKSAEPLATQLREGRKAVEEAVKANKSDAELERLAAAQGNLTGQIAAVRAKSFAKFCALLTPEQRQKADALHSNMRERFQKRSGDRQAK